MGGCFRSGGGAPTAALGWSGGQLLAEGAVDVLGSSAGGSTSICHKKHYVTSKLTHRLGIAMDELSNNNLFFYGNDCFYDSA